MKELKPKKLSNKKLIQSAIEQLECDTGFHIIDIEFGNNYFFFEGGKDSICHFHIKEIPKFIFAFWTSDRVDKEWFDGKMSSKTELIFFTQFERDIDKFKPSHSGFLQGIHRDVWRDLDENGTHMIKKEVWNLSNLEDTLLFMHNHKYQSYIYAQCQLNHSWNSISGFRAFKIYIKDMIYYYKYTFNKWCKLKYTIYSVKKICSKLKNCDYSIALTKDYKLELIVILKDLSKEYLKDIKLVELFSDKFFMNVSRISNYTYNVDNNKDIKDVEISKDMTKLLYKKVKEYRSKKPPFWFDKIIKTNI